MNTIYAWPYLKRPRQSTTDSIMTTVPIFVPPVSGLPSSVQARIRSKLLRGLPLQSYSLWDADAAL